MHRLSTTAALALATFAVAPAARADTRGAEAAAAAVPDAADDDTRFACGKPRGAFEVNLVEEVTVKDLVTWAMGFSCKRFVYTQSITGRSAKLTMITPGKLDAGEAWAVFETGLEAMGLAAVAKGKVYEIVELANAKEAALVIRNRFPDGGGGVVRLLLRPQFAAVHCPVLWLTGARDEKFTALAAEAAPLFPCARQVVIADAGHRVHVEQPVATAEAVRDFLASVGC